MYGPQGIPKEKKYLMDHKKVCENYVVRPILYNGYLYETCSICTTVLWKHGRKSNVKLLDKMSNGFIEVQVNKNY